ncbi:hypothetical protein [Deinococcus sp. QL22]|uniref:hypothetical protein n=1 Tax=Deinococcus sp. QL22 TaxID=2939437 RepID=UPI0020182822|nr:hypothetical protein [Deinococcus sp. QL22]UQN06753.1 hypothetical protein M1R55_02190 [Deinococcus sp. QL22]
MHHKVKQEGTVSGWVHWEVLNADGAVAQEGEQPNLILDRGLNTILASSNLSDVTNFGIGLWAAFRHYLAVGTGSTAPAVGQTTLATEVARAANGGGFTAESTNVYSQPAGFMVGAFTIVRVIDITAAHNLTEFGFSEATGTNVNIRELFRDGTGTPITLSVQAGQQLKVTHTLTVTVPSITGGTDASFTVTGIGLLAGKETWWMKAGVTAASMESFWATNFASNGTLQRMSAVNTMDRADRGGAHDTSALVSATKLTYVSGTFKVTKRYVITTAQLNAAHHGWFIGYQLSSSPEVGYKFGLTNPATITKASTHKLTLDFELTLGRA